jgi:hypothetical protein
MVAVERRREIFVSQRLCVVVVLHNIMQQVRAAYVNRAQWQMLLWRL